MAFRDVPTEDIPCPDASPIVAKYPSNLFMLIPAMSALLATSAMPSASPPASVADAISTAESLSTIESVSETETLYPFIAVVRYLVDSLDSIAPTFDKIILFLIKVLVSSTDLPCLNQSDAAFDTSVVVAPNSSPRLL